MLVRIVNDPVANDWGSTTLIPELTGRTPGTTREAELWLGAHPLSPARVVSDDGSETSLIDWLNERQLDQPRFLAKLLAAAAPLSIQVHPNPDEAATGFADEEARGVPLRAAERIFKDPNPKPEMIVAESERFVALGGVRPISRSLATLREIPGAEPLVDRLQGAESVSGAIAWLLGADDEARAVTAAIADAQERLAARGGELGADADTIRRITAEHPEDPGLAVALLFHRIELQRGEGIEIPAGSPHCYLEGLGIELLAPSDNVLRGGLTTKHVDASGFAEMVDGRPGPEPRMAADELCGATRWHAHGLELRRITERHAVDARGAGVILVTDGRFTVAARDDTPSLDLEPGDSAYATDLAAVTVEGSGRAWIARATSPDSA